MAEQYPEEGYSTAVIQKDLDALNEKLSEKLRSLPRDSWPSGYVGSMAGTHTGGSGTSGADDAAGQQRQQQPAAVVMYEAVPPAAHELPATVPSAPLLEPQSSRPPRWEWKSAADGIWTAYPEEVSAKMEEHLRECKRNFDLSGPSSRGSYCDLKRLYESRWDGTGEKKDIRRVPAAPSGMLRARQSTQ
jgi:hypothetical protein